MESKYKRLLGNSIWNFAGNAGSKLIAFLLLPFYTKWLGTEGYGFSDLIHTYSSLFGGIVTLCVSDAILIFVKDKSITDKKSYYSSATTAAFFLFITWAFVVFVIKQFHIDGRFIIDNIWYILGMIISVYLQTSSQQMSLALNRIKVYSFSGLVLCVNLFFFSFLLIPKYGVVGYVYSTIIANIITSFYSIVTAGAWRYLSVSFISFSKIKELLKYSIPLIPNAVIWWLVSSLNRPLMESHIGLSAIGLYSVASKFPAIITMLYSLFSVSWTVSVIEEYGKPDFESFNKKVFRISFGGLVISSIVLMLMSQFLLRIMTAPEFHEAYKYMVVMIITSVLSCLSSFYGTCFSVVKQSKYFLYSSIWGAMSAVVFNYILIPRLAIYGAVLSNALSFLVMSVSRYIYSLKFVKAKLIGFSLLYILILSSSSVSILLFDGVILRSVIPLLGIGLIVFLERKNISYIKVIVTNRFFNKRLNN